MIETENIVLPDPNEIIREDSLEKEIEIRTNRLNLFIQDIRQSSEEAFWNVFEEGYTYTNKDAFRNSILRHKWYGPCLSLVSEYRDQKRLIENNFGDKRSEDWFCKVLNKENTNLLTYALPFPLLWESRCRWGGSLKVWELLRNSMKDVFWERRSNAKWLKCDRLNYIHEHRLEGNYLYIFQIDLAKNKYD